MKKKKPNPIALLPIVVFLVLYLGVGIYFEYIHPVEGQMGFYVMSVVVAFMIALVVAFLQNGKVSFDDKMKICAKGIGDENITIMIFIFLMQVRDPGPVPHRLPDLHVHGNQRRHNFRARPNRGHRSAERRFQPAFLHRYSRRRSDVRR